MTLKWVQLREWGSIKVNEYFCIKWSKPFALSKYFFASVIMGPFRNSIGHLHSIPDKFLFVTFTQTYWIFSRFHFRLQKFLKSKFLSLYLDSLPCWSYQYISAQHRKNWYLQNTDEIVLLNSYILLRLSWSVATATFSWT